jgi:acetyl esterase/lipase
MKYNFRKINTFFSIKNVSSVLIILNLACIILGVFYVIIPIYNLLWEIFGIILFITLFGNLLLVYLNTIKLNKTTKVGNRLNLVSYVYLIFIILGMLIIPISNFFISITYSSLIRDNIGLYGLIFIFYFGILLFGESIAYIDYKKVDNRGIWDLKIKGDVIQTKKTYLIKIILKTILGFFSVLTLFFGILFAFSILFGVWTLGIIVPQFAFAFSILFLATTILSLKLLKRKKREKLYLGIALTGIIISVIHLIPLLLTPYSIFTAEFSFTDSFGANWRSNIDPSMEAKYFKTSHFTSPGLFLGIPPKDCNYQADVLFLNGSESNEPQDKNITLYFDVFWPKADAADFPGRTPGGYSIIIKIHGGGWSSGDKGYADMMQVNKYFAAQGYIVYDIQYGLNIEPLSGIVPTPPNVLGIFDINDMVRHIGNFTQYIANSTNQFSASVLNGNLDYVFVTGGSAGGHLTCTTALGIASNNYTEYFGSGLTIKGVIPFYPANGRSGLDGLPEFKNPENFLVYSSSPPMLIYQGTHDFSCAAVSINIKSSYNSAGNQECCIIWLPLSGHANDIYFSGHYNQVFLYYMERFLYLCVNGFIT